MVVFRIAGDRKNAAAEACGEHKGRSSSSTDGRFEPNTDDLIVMPRLLIMAESSAKACAPRSTTHATALLPTILFALFAAL